MASFDNEHTRGFSLALAAMVLSACSDPATVDSSAPTDPGTPTTGATATTAAVPRLGASRTSDPRSSVAVQPIRLFGDPVLRQRAVEVDDFDKEVRQLVTDLTDTMLAAPGAGLAAPQIGVGLRVFTWNVEGHVGHLVNPSLELSDDTQDGAEGCLSLPELTYDCLRALSVVATGFDMHGEPVRIEASEYLARAMQHETDHLDGILFIDRLTPLKRKMQMTKWKKAQAEAKTG